MPRSTGRGKPRSPTPVTLGHAIEDAMHNAELVGTQERLAVMIGVDQTTVSKWIRGTVNITVARIADIEDACRLPAGSSTSTPVTSTSTPWKPPPDHVTQRR